jgi:hypothetical protein
MKTAYKMFFGRAEGMRHMDGISINRRIILKQISEGIPLKKILDSSG